MRITKLNVRKDSTCCSFCDKGELSSSGMGLSFPYETVYRIERNGNGIQAQICEECLKELNIAVNRSSFEFEVGYLVAPVEGHGFRSGYSAYHEAVVVSVDPFILASTEADMLWREQKKEDFDFISIVSGKTLKKCLAILK